jgi:hypothetical protein
MNTRTAVASQAEQTQSRQETAPEWVLDALPDQPDHYLERIYDSPKMNKVSRNGVITLRMCFHGFHGLRKLKLQYRLVWLPFAVRLGEA